MLGLKSGQFPQVPEPEIARGVQNPRVGAGSSGFFAIWGELSINTLPLSADATTIIRCPGRLCPLRVIRSMNPYDTREGETRT